MSNITLEPSKNQKTKNKNKKKNRNASCKGIFADPRRDFSTEEQVERQPEKGGRFVVYHENV